MRVVVLTSHRYGTASRCLPALCERPDVDVAAVVIVAGRQLDGKRDLERKVRKVRRIGVLGAVNGLRLRRWYEDERTEDVAELAAAYGVPVRETPRTNCDATRDLLRESGAELGLSLGNGYIAESVFTVPRFGMINIHGEVLPEFKGAQSVIWPIYEGVRETGFTIHQVARKIDAGEILYVERFPIAFHPSLRETVAANVRTIRDRVPGALAEVCGRYEEFRSRAVAQTPARSYTTPTLWQFLRMQKNNRRFYLEASGQREPPAAS